MTMHKTKANLHLHAAHANGHIVRILVPGFCEKVKCLKGVSSRWLSLCDFGDGGSDDDADYADGEADDGEGRWK